MKFPEGAIKVAYVILEQSAERVMITDRQGTILYVNPTFERVTGYSRAEALGQTPRLIKSGHHDQQFYQQLWDALLSGQSFQARFVNKRKNGELYYEEQTIAPLRDAQGNIAYFISTAVDLTSRVRAEDARKLAEESLYRIQKMTWTREERVIELKQEINALLAQLGQAPKYIL
jgi:PAS domain S-box-containing protein